MGRQVLTGISPLAIRQCTALPEYFNVTDIDVMGLLEPGKFLDDEMAVSQNVFDEHLVLRNFFKKVIELITEIEEFFKHNRQDLPMTADVDNITVIPLQVLDNFKIKDTLLPS